MFDDKLSTVWSAPNYCYRCGNLASILEVSETLQRTFNIFDRSEKSVIDDPTLPDVNKVQIARRVCAHRCWSCISLLTGTHGMAACVGLLDNMQKVPEYFL